MDQLQDSIASRIYGNVEWHSVHRNRVALREMAQRNVEPHNVHTNGEMAQRNVE